MSEALPHPDHFFLRAARGWLELGNHREAEAELAQVRPEFAAHPDVLEARFQSLVGQRRHAEALGIARQQVAVDAVDHRGHLNLGNALFWLEQPEAACDAVTAVLDRFPAISALPYNLACYCVRMGRLDQARAWLDRSFASGRRENIIAYALTDPDLEALWEYLRALPARGE